MPSLPLALPTRAPAHPLATACEPSLCTGFLESVQRFPERPALVLGGRTLSYRDLAGQVAPLAATIEALDEDSQPLVAILAHRSLTAYAGVLAALVAGRGYVPLNPKFPPERIRHTLSLSGSTVVIVGREALPQLHALLQCEHRPLTVLVPEIADLSSLARQHPTLRLLGADDLVPSSSLPEWVDPPTGSIAYLLFTSGSTGVPKGVPVTHANARAYVAAICDRYAVSEHDRFSQMSDLTFDWSIQDLFPCWERGACLVSVPENTVFAPAKLIRDQRITMWASVPSVVTFMQRMHTLKPGAFPSVRCSVFCGEPLTAKQAEAWSKATPNAVLENLYGPTETTVAVTGYRWDPARSPAECPNGIVPLGWAFEGQAVITVDENGRATPPGVVGEICIGGSQVTPGYWNDPTRTAERFVALPERGPTRWYRTGDIGWADQEGCLHFTGRVDHQVKVRGFRVELAEVDHVVDRLTDAQQVVSLAWPIQDGSAEGIVTFVAGAQQTDEAAVVSGCRQRLPDYMVPRQIIFLETLPLNVNGKVDRRRLMDLLEQEPL